MKFCAYAGGVDSSDPTVEQLRALYPEWRVWKGVDDFWYAQGPPPAARVIRDENTTELRAQIRSEERTVR